MRLWGYLWCPYPTTTEWAIAQYHLPRQALTCTSYDCGRAHSAEAPAAPLSLLTAHTTTPAYPKPTPPHQHTPVSSNSVGVACGKGIVRITKATIIDVSEWSELITVSLMSE